MSILLNKDSRVIVQGFTGSEGTFHATQMIEYGTTVVGGVTPGKGRTGTSRTCRCFNTVREAVRKTLSRCVNNICSSIRYAADAIMEAANGGIKLIVCNNRRNSCFGYGKGKRVPESICLAG